MTCVTNHCVEQLQQLAISSRAFFNDQQLCPNPNLTQHCLPQTVSAKGHAMKIMNPEGVVFYDFLAAYSAVNQRHSHPEIVAVSMLAG